MIREKAFCFRYQTMLQEMFPTATVYPFVSEDDRKKQEALIYVEGLVKDDRDRTFYLG